MKTTKIAVERDLIAGPRFYEQELRRVNVVNADLLAALEALSSFVLNDGNSFTQWQSRNDPKHANFKARAAIAKARGAQ